MARAWVEDTWLARARRRRPEGADGAFAMLARDRSDTPELTQVRRFRHEWERDTRLQLRLGGTHRN